MSERIDLPPDQTQEKTEPQIEEDILELLDGDLQKAALNLIADMKNHQLAPRLWVPHYWRIAYESHYLCLIIINSDRWRVFFFSGDYSGEFDDAFGEIVRNSACACVSCVEDCLKGTDMTIFGKEIPNACFQFPIQFENPDDATLECIMHLAEYWKEAAPRSESWHCH